MTTEHEATRTLVKSPPELWAECSDASSLARHLGEFGEISITRLEPETTVAWEGEHASGTVQIEPSGWGTRVTLTALTKVDVPEAPEAPEPPAADEPLVADEPPVADEPDVAEAFEAGSIETEIHTDEEESDATATDALEDPNPVSTADIGPARARWRRLTARMRGLLGADEADAESDDEGPHESDELSGSVPPPPAPSPPVSPPPELAVEPWLVEPEPDTGDVEPWPAAADPAAPEAPTPAEPAVDAETVLASALDSLGQAHHRPFSRA
jgi:hypothetical protein